MATKTYTNTGICIWCGKKFPEVSFQSKPHVLSIRLGGDEIGLDICDDCNHYFGTATQGKRVPLSAQKKRLPKDSRSCHIVPNHRTFIDDYLKILDFIDWLKVAYPEKAKFLTEKS